MLRSRGLVDVVRCFKKFIKVAKRITYEIVLCLGRLYCTTNRRSGLASFANKKQTLLNFTLPVFIVRTHDK